VRGVPEDELTDQDWSSWPRPDEEPPPPTKPVPAGRGGPRPIPRPYNARPGGSPAWATLVPEKRRPVVGDVQEAFATLGPARPSERELAGTIGQPSAVLAPLYDQDGLAHVVLTRRTMNLRSHAGEVSFPGGRVEPDESPSEAARREACEEVAIEPATVEIVGELDHLSTVSSGSFIVPYVGVLPERPDTRANPGEVDRVLHVSLAELADPAIYREELWTFPDGVERPVHFFELVGDTVWGATAAMLRQLLGIATGTLGRGDMGHP
jgi:8-oxo-dGTP pyrophosphatase MutT (NUDIX family)